MPGARYLIYSPGLSQSLALVGLLRRHRSDARLIGVVLPGESSRAIGGVYDGLIADDELDTLPDDIFVPTGGEATFALARRHGDVSIGALTLTDKALRFTDKAWSLALAAEAGVPVPRTWTAAADIESWPVFYKSAVEGDGKVRGIASGPRNLPDGKLIYQELVRGRGVHAVGFLARDGRIVAAHGHFEVESYPRSGGSAVILETCREARVSEYTERLVRASNYSGWGLAEFKYCPRRDDYLFMEINPKFWASWELALLNEPAFARLLFGIESRPAGIRRMLFLDRALRRGPAFWPRLAVAAARGDAIRAYPGWPVQAVAGMVPPPLLRLARRYLSG